MEKFSPFYVFLHFGIISYGEVVLEICYGTTCSLKIAYLFMTLNVAVVAAATRRENWCTCDKKKFCDL